MARTVVTVEIERIELVQSLMFMMMMMMMMMMTSSSQSGPLHLRNYGVRSLTLWRRNLTFKS